MDLNLITSYSSLLSSSQFKIIGKKFNFMQYKKYFLSSEYAWSTEESMNQ